jgi:Zn-dependent peptidase ImmA (M78 family)/transcriptional regulator with XRE-family HTH domain
MSNRDDVFEDDVLDGPLLRYAAADAVLVLDDGTRIDLNAVPDPFTGELPRPASEGGDASAAEDRARVGRRLQALREDASVSKQALAQRAGLGNVWVTRAESGDERVGLQLVTSLIHALDARLADIAAPDAPELSMRAITRIGTQVGAPREILDRVGARAGRRAFARALDRGFGWTREALMAGEPRSAPAAAAIAFKARAEAPPRDAPVLALAQTMSEFTAQRFDGGFDGMPRDPLEVRRVAQERSGMKQVTLEGLLGWAWDAGIAVLPFAKATDFVAAVWYSGGTPVIILGESRTVAAYWLFDLAHELGHLALGHVENGGIVDVDSPQKPDLSDRQEREANAFALTLLLGEPERLLADVRARTRNDAPNRFKFAVRDVADEFDVSPGVLGFAAAYEMSDVPRDQDRWGSAHNLAKDEDPVGRERVQAKYRARVRLDEVDEVDGALLAAVVLHDG